MKYNSVTIAPVRSLEIGDLIAHEFLGDVISGLITGIAHVKMDLTASQIEYMTHEGLTIPEGEYDDLGSRTSCLVFGTFGDWYANEFYQGHMYLEYSVNVAVFPYDKDARKALEPKPKEA
jgi:hypothetical protein